MMGGKKDKRDRKIGGMTRGNRQKRCQNEETHRKKDKEIGGQVAVRAHACVYARVCV